MSEAEHTPQHEELADHARFGSGIATIYRALDRLVVERQLDDAAVVVDVAPLGRQVLHAGRRPLHDDDRGLLTREPGLYVDPAVHSGGALDDPLVGELIVALAELALRHDVARLLHEQEPA